MNSIYPNIRSLAPQNGVWYPYGDNHRVIFDDDDTFRVWDNYQWQHLGETLFRCVEQQLHHARTAPDGNLVALAGWEHVTTGKIVGVLMDALDIPDVVAACTERAVLVSFMIAVCEVL